jgi:hypothetical protein
MANLFKLIGQAIRSSPGLVGKMLARTTYLHRMDQVDAAAAAANSLHAAQATVGAAVLTWLKSDLIAGGLTALAACPRQLQVTTAGATPADAPATGVLTGWTVNGLRVQETLTIPQTATTVNSTYFYSDFESFITTAADGAGATLALGFTAKLGLRHKAKGRGAALAVFTPINEMVDGALAVTAGSITDPATDKPNGSYSPNSAPNAARDYLMLYEIDPTAGVF